MLALTAILLAAGFPLCVFGLLGFAACWNTAPDRADLHHARTVALSGQGATAYGLLLLIASGHPVAGPVLGLVVAAAIVMTLAALTWAPLRHLAPSG